MVTFTGRISKLGGSNYFSYRWNPDASHGEYKLACGGWSTELLTGEPVDHWGVGGESMTWGYCAHSSDLLSVSILATALDPDWLIKHKWHCWKHRARADILKHYRAFTEEIVANLPDQWTMTSDEVLAWIKKKEASCS